FPEAIDLMVRALRSGLPISEAIIGAGHEIGGPVGDELGRVEAGMRMGRDLEGLLWDIANRIDVPEFRFFIIALSVQRETGGNLAETLANLADVLRRRRQMRAKVRAMSSETRATTMILAGMPVPDLVCCRCSFAGVSTEHRLRAASPADRRPQGNTAPIGAREPPQRAPSDAGRNYARGRDAAQSAALAASRRSAPDARTCRLPIAGCDGEISVCADQPAVCLRRADIVGYARAASDAAAAAVCVCAFSGGSPVRFFRSKNLYEV